MKLCAFCENPGGNAEHIIAQWLIDRMEATHYQIVVAHRKETSLRGRPPHGLKSYITKAVCDRCNNGWMSLLEMWFQQNMGMLVEPTWPKLGSEVLRQALREREMLAKWALKTAVMMDRNTMMENVVDDATPKVLFHGQLVDGLIVDVAHIHERAVGAILSRGFWIRNGGRPPQWQENANGLAFKVVIQLNHLAIRVLRAPGTQVTYFAPNGRLPLRCHPHSADPDAFDFRFHDLTEFDRVLLLETRL